MVNPRQKEKRHRCEVRKIIESKLEDVRIVKGDQGSGGSGAPDIVGLEGWWPELKWVERLDIPGWWRKLEADMAGGDSAGRKPILIFRQSGKPNRAIVLLADFLDLVAYAEDLARDNEVLLNTNRRLAAREIELLGEIDRLRLERPQ
jgi:hypothetical protein